MPQIKILGAAGTVTGSRHLVESSDQRILVDCGLFQGLKALRLRNWEPFPIDPESIDAVLLTHGHLDHVGYLACLVRDGFKGSIYCTEPTAAVARVILQDGAKIQEEEAERANHKGFSRHKPALPLYTSKDALRALEHFVTVPTHQWIGLSEQNKCRWMPVGHILGACFLELDLNGLRVVLSGDIGRQDDPLLYAPERPKQADIVIMESTYGNRIHPQEDTGARLKSWVHQIISKKATLYLPVFAVERTQLLLLILHKMLQSGEIPKIPIILDSPMGTRVVDLFNQFPDWHRLDADASEVLTESVRVVESVGESMKLARKPGPRIVLAGAGMLTGGRILNYLITALPNKNNIIALTGYQAEGTRGRDLQEGASQLKIQGNYFSVHAQIKTLGSLSAHADQTGLCDWLQDIDTPPQQVILVHGEPEAAEGLKQALTDRYSWPIQIAEEGQTFQF